MKENKECKIVQDLLPNYIEKLTSSETNQYIEEHMSNCNPCKQMLQNMQKEILVEAKINNKKEVKYIKKYRNKMRILSAIILVVFLIFLVATIRKAIILSNLSQKAEETMKSNNYHMTIYGYEKGVACKREEFVLNDKIKIKTTRFSERGTFMYQTFIYKAENGETKENIYTESQGKKTAQLGHVIDTYIERRGEEKNPLYTENALHLLVNAAVFTNIQQTSLNGIDCYLVSNFKGNHTGSYNGPMYINKENGLIIGSMDSQADDGFGKKLKSLGCEVEYEFGTVTEKDLVEPNIAEYEVHE